MGVDAGTIYSEVRIELGKLKGDIQRTRTEFNKFGKANQQQATKVQKSWTDKFKKINLAGVAAFAGIGIALKKAIDQFANFEQAMANVQSVARATPEEFRKLEQAAQKAGETTKFTATESAEALYSLASAGLSASESAAALDGVLQLAGATQADLADTAASVTAALSQYGLQAEDSARVSNVFAAAIANSQANMTKLSSAMRQVGPVAGTLGLSIEETTGALQALFDAGFKGEQAGTGLRNVLSSLANQADPTVQKLQNLGIAFEDVNPSANSLTDVIGTLADAGLETGDVLNVFGREAGPQLLTLLQTGEEGLKEYTDAITDTNSAAEAYEIQMDTLEGSMAEMKSALEAGAISFVKEFAPAIRTVVEALTNMLRWIGQLPKSIKIFLGILVGGIPIIGAATIAFTTLAGAVGAALGPITLITGAIAGVVAGITAIAGAVRKARIENITERFGDLSEELDISIERMSKLERTAKKLGASGDDEIGKLITKLQEFQEETGISDDELDELIKTAKRMGATDEDVDKVIGKVRELTEEFGVTNDQIVEMGRVISRGATAGFEDANEQVTELAKNTGLSKEAIIKMGLASGNVTDEYKEQLQLLLDQINKQKETNRIGNETNDLEALRNEKLKTRADLAEDAAEAEKDNTDELEKQIDYQAQLVESMQDKLGRAAAETTKLAEAWEGVNAVTKEQKRLVAQEIIGLYEDLADNYAIAAARSGEAFGNADVLKELAEQAQAYLDSLKDTNDELKEMPDNYTDISAQTESYEMQLLKLVGTEEEVIEAERRRAIAAVKASGASMEAMREQIRVINRLYDELVLKSEESSEDVSNAWGDSLEEQKSNHIDFVKSLISSFSAYVTEITALYQVQTDNQIEEVNRRLAAELEAAGLAEETRMESLQRQLQEARDAGDEETVARLQDDIERLKITKKYEKEKAKIRYKAEMAEWRSKILLALADAAQAVISIWAKWAWNPAVAVTLTALAAGVAGIQLATIAESKPEKPSFKTGGGVFPILQNNARYLSDHKTQPHYQTGGLMVPSGPEGRSITVAENGAPELMLNAGGEGAALLDEFANRIVRAMGSRGGSSGGQINLQLNMDGRKVAENTVSYVNNGQVRVKL